LLFNQLPNDILSIKSDPFFLGKNFADINLKEIENEFGNNFNTHFKESNLNKWSGPYQSSFGHHIIFINDYRAGFYPSLDVVIDKVELDLLAEKKERAIKSFIDEIKSEYTVIINPNLRIE
jgi:parvulin-like peptidyl-prolyl isomerase